MSVLKYFKNILLSPSHRVTGPKCNFFFKFATRSLTKKMGRQAPVAPGVGDRPFFARDLVANLFKKKLHLGPVALWEGDRGIFLKYFKTDIYF